MNRQFSVSSNLRILLSTFSLFILNSFQCISQTDSINNTNNYCKKLAIESAQLADETYFYAQQSYFEKQPILISNNIDTALFSINDAIISIDSAIIMASDSAKMALKYAKISLEFQKKAQKILVFAKNSLNFNEKRALLKKAMVFSENATIDAYHASFYFAGNKKRKKKEDLKDSVVTEKQITKLDIDQTLFTILKEDLNVKSETNKEELQKLSSELLKTKDPAKIAGLKSQIKKLELKNKELVKKNSDAEAKLLTINNLIAENEKNKINPKTQKDTIFSKTIGNIKDEWNKPIKTDADLPVFLVYQLQLGVFKANVLPETFKGLTPIYSKITDKGICYTTGLFEKLSDAREAKKNVNAMGLTDAFIVAYYNKKKITLPEAVKLEKK